MCLALNSCGESPDDFKDTVIVAAKLDNLAMSWRGAGYADVTGMADLVVTDLDGEEHSRRVSLSGGLFGSVAGGADANKIWPNADPIHADFFVPQLPDSSALLMESVELSDGGVIESPLPREVLEETFDLIKAGDLFGAYFGGQAGISLIVGWDAQILFKTRDIGLTLGHPTLGLGMAVGLEWLSINQL